VVFIIFAIISCVPASDRKTIVTSPVTVIVSARIKVTQLVCFFPQWQDEQQQQNNNSKIITKLKKKLASSPTTVTK